MVKRKKIYINGKFLMQPMTGVQRFALEVTKGIDSILSNGGFHNLEIILLLPRGVNTKFDFRNIKITSSNYLMPLLLWEHLMVPIMSFGGVLLNLTGSCPLFKCSQFITIHDTAIWDYPTNFKFHYRIYYKLLYWSCKRFSAKFLTVSNFSKNSIASHLDIAYENICVVYNSAEHIDLINQDLSVFYKFKIIPKKYVLLVGSFTSTKNINFVVQTLSDYLNKNGIDIVVVGGEDSKIFSPAAFTANKKIIRTGRISDNMLKALYCEAQVFIFPSIYEGFGIPGLEAQRCGTSVICSDRAALPEVYLESAIYFDPQSPSSLLSAYEKFANLDDRNTLVCDSIENSKRFSWRKTATETLNYVIKYD